MNNFFESTDLRLSEGILILSGLLFLTNTIFVALGGDFKFLLIAKVVYAIGLVVLIFRD